jgi:hypothetical protein
VKHDILEIYVFSVPYPDKENTHRTQVIRLSNDGELFVVISTNLIQGFQCFTLRNDLQYSPFV